MSLEEFAVPRRGPLRPLMTRFAPGAIDCGLNCLYSLLLAPLPLLYRLQTSFDEGLPNGKRKSPFGQDLRSNRREACGRPA